VSSAGTGSGATSVSWRLEPDTARVAEARRIVGEVLTDWGCEGLIPDAQLVVTELITNAIVHAESPCQVTLDLTDDRLRIQVTDEDPSVPEPQPYDLMREGGRGLLIVGALAAAWGIDEATRGKTVWAELVG
jgi:anti-sigma regulatory factor (Ser/Thr protein kinase)